MKIIIACMLLLSLCVGLFGCAQTPENPTLPSTSEPVESVPVTSEPPFVVDPSVPEHFFAVTMPSLYSDGMCLQRDKELHIQGKSTSEYVAVELCGKMYYGATTDGKFSVVIPPQEAGGPYTMTLYTPTYKKVIKNVYIGEVFLCSGQSNMEMLMSECGEVHAQDIADANNDQIRIMGLPRQESATPQQYLQGAVWYGANPVSVAAFSGVAYLFAREMHEALGVPVGVINASWGGTIAAFWMPNETFETLSAEIEIVTDDNTWTSANLGYNGMIAPMTHYTFRGVVWYQGCSNANHTSVTYDRELEALIRSWREAFRDDTLAFTIIELPRYMDATYWPILRNMQKKVADGDPLACMSVSIDLGEYWDIHPKDKSLFAKRAAEQTLALLFDFEEPVYPTVKTVERIHDNQVKITFDGVGDGLVVKNNGNGFEVSENGSSYSLITEIEWDGNSVTLTSAKPIRFLRYGYRISYPNVAYQEDVTLQLSVWNSYGNPLDQFEIKVD